MAETVRVQVCFAEPDSVFLQALELNPGSTVEQAIRASELLRQKPSLDLRSARAGVYGKLRELDSMVRDGDRIEVYRPLLADPKDARRRRVVKQRRAAKAG